MLFIVWSSLLFLLFFPFILLWGLVLYIYTWLTMGVCKNKESLAGKCAIVTGGTSGIGKETVIGLAKRGADVIIGARSLNEDLIDEIRRAAGHGSIEHWNLDLMNPKSVDNFAQKVKDENLKIDRLVNNA